MKSEDLLHRTNVHLRNVEEIPSNRFLFQCQVRLLVIDEINMLQIILKQIINQYTIQSILLSLSDRPETF